MENPEEISNKQRTKKAGKGEKEKKMTTIEINEVRSAVVKDEPLSKVKKKKKKKN